MAISQLEEKLLEKDYLRWQAREIEAGRMKRPPAPPYDPSKKYVSPLLESNRRKLGVPLEELQDELDQIRRARSTGQTVDYSKALRVGDEIARLKQQEADMAWALREQAEYEEFVRGPRGTTFTQPATKPHPLKRAKGWWKKLGTRKKLLFGGAGIVAATLAFGGKENHNTIEGLHPFSDGMGTEMLREISDFGSGFVGLRGMLIGEITAIMRAGQEQMYKEGFGAYQLYEWERTRGARETLSRFTEHKENQLKFPAMGDRTSFAAHMRGEITEFKEDFASRWDPLRKLATKLYGKTSNDALETLTTRPEFRTAVSTALKGEGKLLGRGQMGEARAYVGEMVLEGQKHKFEFVAKRTLQQGARTASAIERESDLLGKYAVAEAQAMRKLGAERTPSLYGTGLSFCVDRNTLIMEKFQLTKPLIETKKIKLPSGLEVTKDVAENPLSADELVDLKSFMKSAHKKGITHTDMHADNVVRVINPETGKAEVAVLDWGMANRFEAVGGIGGTQAHVMETGAAAVLESLVSRKLGRQVGATEFSQVADMLRVEAHAVGTKASRSSRQAVNAVYQFANKQTELKNAIDELNHLKHLADDTSPAFIDAAEKAVVQKQAAMDEASNLLHEVADTVSGYILKGERAPSVVRKTVADILPDNTTGLKKTFDRVVKREETAYARTELMTAMRDTEVAPGTTASTMALRAKKAAVERNRRFEELTRRTVGAGLRKSATATKGHTDFGSTRSTVV